MKVKINLILFLLSLVITSCYPSESAISTAIAKTQTVSESTQSGSHPTATLTQTASQDICEWFLITQSLRTKRLSGLSEFTQWVQTHNLYALTDVEAREFVEILVDYQPYQEEFVVDWKELGPHPDAVVFWEKELESVELKIKGINEMNQGLKNNDSNLFTHGWDLFIESQQSGHEAETAMLEVRSHCIH